MTADRLGTIDRVREIVEAAITEHCEGGDLYMVALTAAKKIAGDPGRVVGYLNARGQFYGSLRAMPTADHATARPLTFAALTPAAKPLGYVNASTAAWLANCSGYGECYTNIVADAGDVAIYTAAPAPPPADAVRALPPDGEAMAWIRRAYNGESFTAYNMEVAYAAGWQSARRALSAAPAGEGHTKRCASNYTRFSDPPQPYPCDCKPAAGFRWDLLPSYLIDHCEGDRITEEGLQAACAAMLRDPKYSAAAPTPEGGLTARAWKIVEQVAGAGIGGYGQMIGGPSRGDAQDLIAERDQQEGGRHDG